jgi:hypothetical protein
MTRWVGPFQNQLVGDDIALALVVEGDAAVFSERIVSEVGVAVTLVAAPLALGVVLAFVPLLVWGVIVPAVKVFAVRSWKSQTKTKTTSKQKGKTPKECVSNADTHSDLLSKGTAAIHCIVATSPDFHSNVVAKKAAPTVHIGHERFFLNENTARSSLTYFLKSWHFGCCLDTPSLHGCCECHASPTLKRDEYGVRFFLHQEMRRLACVAAP